MVMKVLAEAQVTAFNVIKMEDLLFIRRTVFVFEQRALIGKGVRYM